MEKQEQFPRHIRVLVLEDNLSDVEIIVHTLRRGGYEPVADVVCTEEAYRSQLEQEYDIILSDYTMPQFSAPVALRILQQRKLDIPFIVISGSIGEDRAVAMMREGASDYLLKDRLSRLGVAVENALQQCLLRRKNRAAEESLRKMYQAVEQSADSIMVTDTNGVIEYVNPAFMKNTGFTRDEVIGRKPSLLKSGKHDAAFYGRVWETVLGGNTFRAEFINRKKNGELYHEYQGISPVFDDNGSIVHFISTGKDLTEQRRIEDALRQSEQRYRNLVETALDAIFTLSKEGILTSLNPAFEKITGWNRSEWLDRKFVDLLHEGDVATAKEKFGRMLNGETLPISEYRIAASDGSFVVVEVLTVPKVHNNEIVGIIGIARDVTERKRLEEQFRQAQKMESIGTLAGGIAHDFNNILGIILACSSLIEVKDMKDAAYHQNLETIRRTVHRGATLVRQILTFARKNDPSLTSVAPNDIILEMTKMLELTFPKTIQIVLQLDDALPHILADANQVHQALMNLCVNARDAILDKKENESHTGTITISTTRCRREDDPKLFMGLTADEFIEVRIADTGTGMDESTKQRIFDPFFTTKEIGKGTGLGLAVVYGVMHSVQGTLLVDSTPGHGSTFHLYFPVAGIEAVEQHSHQQSKGESKGGSETILLIEDEESLIQLTTIILESKGYTILTAQTGPEGLERFNAHKDTIDLVFTDFGLPGLDGYSVLKSIKEKKPNVKMLLASGFLEPLQRSDLLQLGVHEIIQKPYEYEYMLYKIREVLDIPQ
jgi:PAS domain S-box-containing protein